MSVDQAKLICFDVDYTLLTDDQQMLPMTEETLQELQERGIKIMLATGKNLEATREIVERLHLTDPLIFLNGSLIQYSSGEVLLKWEIPTERSKQVIQLGDQEGMDMMVYKTTDTIIKEGGKFAHTLDKFGDCKLREVKSWHELADNFDSILKILCIDEDTQRLEKMREILKSSIQDGINAYLSLPFLLEVQPSGVSKGKALQEVAQLLKIPREAIIAFGDGNNDVEMIQFAGTGVAVENATPKLKSVADHIVPSNNEEGPAQFLRKTFNLH